MFKASHTDHWSALGFLSQVFYWPNALFVVQSIVSRQWRKTSL